MISTPIETTAPAIAARFRNKPAPSSLGETPSSTRRPSRATAAPLSATMKATLDSSCGTLSGNASVTSDQATTDSATEPAPIGDRRNPARGDWGVSGASVIRPALSHALAKREERFPRANSPTKSADSSRSRRLCPHWEQRSSWSICEPADLITSAARSLLTVGGGLHQQLEQREVFRLLVQALGVPLHAQPQRHRRVLDGLDDPVRRLGDDPQPAADLVHGLLVARVADGHLALADRAGQRRLGV